MPSIPVTLTVRFLDVADDNQFEAYIYGVAGAGVMFGGPPVCLPGVLYFCPDGFVTRADMAGYLWRAINGRNTPPPVYQDIFTDVTFNQYNSFYIQGIYDLGHHGRLWRRDDLLPQRPGDPRSDVGPDLEGPRTATNRLCPARESSTTCRARASSRTTSRLSTTRV